MLYLCQADRQTYRTCVYAHWYGESSQKTSLIYLAEIKKIMLLPCA